MIDVYTSHKDSPTYSPCACTTVKKLSRLLGRVYDAALAPSKINVTQFAVMRSIARHDGEPLARVADELQMDRTSLYRAITPLERDGWIEVAAGVDGRSRSVRVTSEGARLLREAAVEWAELQHQLITSFGKSAWTSLAAELNRLNECAANLDGAKHL
jgi:DNA-binding MarR family transcriptional regulator